jgi:6-pyruvoyltetrahydropterin/6-carboxytetrahydropterin synthase
MTNQAMLSIFAGSMFSGRFYSSKHYPHSLGLSACFRQWKAESHCNQLHGYSLAFTFYFACDDLDYRNWCMDFGSMKPVKEWLVSTFDHRLMVATDDPMLEVFNDLHRLRAANVNIVPATGCEAFATQAFGFCKKYLSIAGVAPRVQVIGVWCAEHEGNGAGYGEPYIPTVPQPNI